MFLGQFEGAESKKKLSATLSYWVLTFKSEKENDRHFLPNSLANMHTFAVHKTDTIHLVHVFGILCICLLHWVVALEVQESDTGIPVYIWSGGFENVHYSLNVNIPCLSYFRY